MHVTQPLADIAWTRAPSAEDSSTTLVRRRSTSRAHQPHEWPALALPRTPIAPHLVFGAAWLAVLTLTWVVLGGAP